jgi:hypothetical protein
MAKTKRTSKKKYQTTELDGVYLLKMVLYLILGSQWLWIEQAWGNRIPVPVGLLVGLLFAMHDHFQIDRKIEYAVLLLAMFVGYTAGVGIFVPI